MRYDRRKTKDTHECRILRGIDEGEIMKVSVDVILKGDTKDKNRWLYAWRINKMNSKLTYVAMLFASGSVYEDEEKCAIIDGLSWRK